MSHPSQKIIFVTGKGGVGKSVCATALALHRSARGERVLLVELGEKSFLRHLFSRAVTRLPVMVGPKLWLARWSGEDCLREYLLHYLRIETLVDLFFDNRIMRTLVQGAPALKELAILGKITSGVRGVGPDLDFDTIIVDAFATGHFKALLMAPVGMLEAIGVGPMGEHSRAMLGVVKDGSTTSVVITVLPEDLPVTEGRELAEFLLKSFGVRAQILFNRMWSPNLTGEELKGLASSLPADTELQRFSQFLEQKVIEQESICHQFERDGFRVQTLPLVLEQSPMLVARQLAESLQ